jgi:hypothetical protein
VRLPQLRAEDVPFVVELRGGGPAVACLHSSRRRYARTAPFVFFAITSPKVIFGAFGSALSSFSSRTQLDATRVDSSACADVSKRLIEVMTSLPDTRDEERPHAAGTSSLEPEIPPTRLARLEGATATIRLR